MLWQNPPSTSIFHFESTIADTISCGFDRFDLPLDARLEYLTLAVGNAKSHPVSAGGRHETAIAFLTDLEERLEVAQVQLELYTTLLPHAHKSPEMEQKVKALSTKLFTITPVRYTSARRNKADFKYLDSCGKIMLRRSICPPLSC